MEQPTPAEIQIAKLIRFITCAPDRYTSMNPYGRPEVREALQFLDQTTKFGTINYDAAESVFKRAGLPVPYLD